MYNENELVNENKKDKIELYVGACVLFILGSFILKKIINKILKINQ